MKSSIEARKAAQKGNWPFVKESALELIRSDPKNPEGYFLMGLYEKALNHPIKAIEQFERSLSASEERYDAAIELADQLTVAQRNGEAAELVRKYRPLLKNSPLYLDLSGTILTNIGLIEEALPFFEQANELQPDIPLFKGNLAACYSYLGKISESESIYRSLINHHPGHQRNHYRLARLKKAENFDHVREMQSIAEASNLPDERNIYINYAIGKELEDLKQWEDAFCAYKRAGDAATKISNYDIGSDIALIDTIIKKCNSKWFQQSPAPNIKNEKKPIFIVGLPRTGTTLTERILASHSEIQSLGETQFIPMCIRTLSEVRSKSQISQEIIDQVSEKNISKLRTMYEDSIKYRLSDEPYYIEKLPYNFLFLGFIAKAFPDARLVYLDRNPVDACLSMYKQPFTWAYKFSYDLNNLANYYVAHTRLLEHWKSLLGDRLIQVSYEELVHTPKMTIESIFTRIDLEPEEQCFRFYENKSASSTASATQIREKIYSDADGKWKNFKTNLRPLTSIFDQSGIVYE